MKRQLLAASFLIAGTLFSGCAARGAVVVGFAPPPPRYGVIGVAPGPGYVWIDGFWGWSGNRYVWTAGRWAQPPHAHARWVRGEWRHEGRGWRYREGHWR